MATSEPDCKNVDDSKEKLVFQHPNMEELLTLADLAGIKAPGNTMKIIIELLAMNVPPSEIHRLIRDVCKAHPKRVVAKQSSRRAHSSSDHVQENTYTSTS